MTALKCYNRIINVKLLERSKQITLQCEVRKRLYQSLNTCLLTSCGTDSIRPHAISLQLLCNSSSNGCSCGWNTSINSMSYHSMFVNVVVELHYSALKLGTDKVLLTNTELRLSVFAHDRNTEEEIRAPTDLFRFEDFLNTYYPYKVGPITCFHNVNEWSLMCFRFCYVDEWLAMSCFLAWVINKYIQSVWSILGPGVCCEQHFNLVSIQVVGDQIFDSCYISLLSLLLRWVEVTSKMYVQMRLQNFVWDGVLISMCAHVLKLCRASVNAPGGLVASCYTSLMSNLISNPGTAAIFRGEGFLWQTFWNRDMSKLVWQELVIYKKSDCSILWRKYLICAMNVEITKWCFWELFYSLHKVNDCKNTKWQTPWTCSQ